MDQIFGRSKEVCVWLGKDQSSLEDFSWFHQTLLPAFEEHFNAGEGMSDVMQVVTRANLGIDPTPRWRAYVFFYEQHRWFHRCWILQGVALAHNIAIFCGSASLDFEDICDLSWLLFDLGAAIVPTGWKPEGLHTDMIVGHKGYKIARQRALCQMPVLHPNNGVPTVTGAETPLQMYFGFLLSTLSAVSGHEATDPRDKVYAALGMAARFLPPGEEVNLVPDYHSSTVEVYQKITFCLIQNLPFLAVLSYVEDSGLRILPDLPSWVPDFRASLVSTTYASRYEVYPHNACSSGKGTYPRSILGSTLKLYGGHFDEVMFVAETMGNYRTDVETQSGSSPTGYSLEIFYHLLYFLSCLQRDYVNGQSRLEALSRTLILNQLDREPPPSNTSKIFRDWLLGRLGFAAFVSRQMDEAQLLLEACMNVLQNLEEVRDMTLPSEGSILLYAKLTFSNDVTVLNRAPNGTSSEGLSSEEEEDGADNVWIHQNLYDRGLAKGLFLRQRLYKTSCGYIGLGPPSTQPGDQVCFLCDSTVPFILRPQAKTRHYTLVGETYLHGFMNGEVLRTDFKDRIGPVYLV